MISLTEIKLPMQYIQIQSYTPTSARIVKSMLVAFAGRTDIFIKYNAILGSVVMENDNHFSKHFATSTYYVILIPYVIEKRLPFLRKFYHLSEYANYSRYQIRKTN